MGEVTKVVFEYHPQSSTDYLLILLALANTRALAWGIRSFSARVAITLRN